MRNIKESLLCIRPVAQSVSRGLTNEGYHIVFKNDRVTINPGSSKGSF